MKKCKLSIMSKKLTEEEAAARKEYRKQYLKKWIENNRERFNQIQQKSRKNSIAHAEYKEKFKETHKKWKYNWNKEYQNTLKGTANRRIQSYKKMDEDRGFGKDALDFDSEWMIENILLKPCVHCGETDWHKIGCNRIDNTKPHTKDNVEPCCRSCNCKLK